MFFIVKTGCCGDDPCDLINGNEVGGDGEQDHAIIALIMVSGGNLAEREERIDIVDNQTINQYTPPTSPHTLTNIRTLAILSPGGRFSRIDVVYN